MSKNNEEIEVIEANSSKQENGRKVQLSDANLFLNSGKMGFIFIGVVVTFMILAFAMSVINIPNYVYLIIALIVGPILFFNYLKMHKDDENKLD